MTRMIILAGILTWCATVATHRVFAEDATAVKQPPAVREPLLRAVDLSIGESAQVVLCDDSTASLKLLALQEQRDTIRKAVRRVEVEVNGERVELVSATYKLARNGCRRADRLPDH